MKIAIILSIAYTFSTIQSIFVNAQDIETQCPCIEGIERGSYMKCVNMAVKQMKTLGISKQDFKRVRKQAKKKARKCPYGKSETTEGSEDTEDDEDMTTEDSGDGEEKNCTTILKENQCNNKWGGICSWNGVSCGPSSDGLGGISLGGGVAGGSILQSSGGSVSESSGQGQGKGTGNGGGKLKPNKPFKPDKQAGGGGQGQGGGKWGGNKPNKLDKPWGGNKPQGSGSVGKVKPNQGNQGQGSSSGESEDSEETTEETEDSEDTSEDDGEEVDCSSAPKQMPCSKKGGGVCAWINGSCQPKRRHLYLRK